ncbi:hypothetical protein MT418_002343 [Batrachochytrium dendrobatidis]
MITFRSTSLPIPPFVVFGRHTFKAEIDDEISFAIGEPVVVVQKDEGYNDGWWKGLNMRGFSGLFPCSFITFENIAGIDISALPHVRAALSAGSIAASNQSSIQDAQVAATTSAHNSPVATHTIPAMTSTAIGKLQTAAYDTDDSNSLFKSINDHMDQLHIVGLKNSVDSPTSDHQTKTPQLSRSATHTSPITLNTDISVATIQSPISESTASIYSSLNHTQGNVDSGATNRDVDHYYSNRQQVQQEDSYLLNLPSKTPPLQWTVADVVKWAEMNGFESAPAIFADNEIDGTTLLKMTLARLRELGIEPLADRVVLMHRILFLKDYVASQNDSDELLTDYSDSQLSYAKPADINDIKEYLEDSSKRTLGRFTVSDYLDQAQGDIFNQAPPVPLSSISTDTNEYNLLYPAKKNNTQYIQSQAESEPHPISFDLLSPTEYTDQESRKKRFGAAFGKFTSKFSVNRRGSKDDTASSDSNLNALYSNGSALPASLNSQEGSSSDYEGWLHVRVAQERSWHRRYCVLKDNLVQLFKAQQTQPCLLAISLGAQSKILPDVAERSKTPYLFKIETISDTPEVKSFPIVHFAAETQISMVGWINILVRASQNELRTAPLPLLPIKDIRRSEASQSALNSFNVDANISGPALRQVSLQSTSYQQAFSPAPQKLFSKERRSASVSSAVSTLSTMPPAKFVPDGRSLTIQTHRPSATSPGLLGHANTVSTLPEAMITRSASAVTSPYISALNLSSNGVFSNTRTSFDDSVTVPMQKGIVKRSAAFQNSTRSQSSWK